MRVRMRTHDDPGAMASRARLGVAGRYPGTPVGPTNYGVNMQLNHLDLSVTDVATATDFLTRHFGFTLLQTKGNHGMAVLAGTGGTILVLTRNEAPSYPKTFHIGFLADNAGDVGAKHAELEAAGISGLSALQEMRGGTGFYCRSDWGILLEVASRVPASAA